MVKPTRQGLVLEGEDAEELDIQRGTLARSACICRRSLTVSINIHAICIMISENSDKSGGGDKRWD